MPACVRQQRRYQREENVPERKISSEMERRLLAEVTGWMVAPDMGGRDPERAHFWGVWSS